MASKPTVKLLNELTNLDTTHLTVDLYTKRNLEKLVTDIKLLNVAIDNYNKLFNFQTYTINKLEKTRKRLESLSSMNAPRYNINKAQANIHKISEEYATSRNIFASNDPIAKEMVLKKFISTLDDLINAYNEVRLDLTKIEPTILFTKPSGLFTINDRKDKMERIIHEISNLIVTLKQNRKQFRDLLTELTNAQTSVESAEMAEKIGKRIESLRNTTLPLSNTTKANRGKTLRSVIAKIQTKINNTTGIKKGGKYRRTLKKIT